MTQQQLIEKYSSLPAEAQKIIDDFVATLSQKYKDSCEIEQPENSPVEEQAFVGMWRDAPDLKDSTAWVRNARENHWGQNR